MLLPRMALEFNHVMTIVLAFARISLLRRAAETSSSNLQNPGKLQVPKLPLCKLRVGHWEFPWILDVEFWNLFLSFPLIPEVSSRVIDEYIFQRRVVS